MRATTLRPTADKLTSTRYRPLLLTSLAILTLAHLAGAITKVMDATHAPLSEAFGRPLVTLLTDTRFGALWVSRSVLLLAMGVLVWALSRGGRLATARGRGARLWQLAVMTGGLLLLTTSLGSHAASLGGPWYWPVVNDWLHSLAAALWVGGLVTLAVLLPELRARAITRQAIARFTPLAFGSVVALTVTGLISARWQVAEWDGIVATRYGFWLTVKLVLVAAGVGLGAYHLLVVRPHVETRGSDTAQQRFLGRSMRIEALLGVAIVGAVGLMTAAVPARELLGGSQDTFGVTRLVAGASVTLRASPGHVGTNEFSVVVAAEDPASFGEVERVILRLLPPDGGTARDVELRQAGAAEADTYRGADDALDTEGNWAISVVVERTGDVPVVVPFAVTAGGDELRPTGAQARAGDGRTTRALTLAALWLLAGLSLAIAGARMRVRRAGLAYGLLALAGVSLVMGSIVVAAGSGAS